MDDTLQQICLLLEDYLEIDYARYPNQQILIDEHTVRIINDQRGVMREEHIRYENN